MRVTPNVVREVANHAQEFTGGVFEMHGVGQDIGRGTRYIDGKDMVLTWAGRHGAREASAYYIGAMLGWAQATGTTIPDDVRQYCQPVQDAYRSTPGCEEWEERGRRQAQGRAEVTGKAVPRDN